ncbi:MAG: methyltransferase domain-containing protein [Candidatus ainarchaeum sp.]|nr:methyltransferase domain-containing protein [Candidatus ainarchaeum sp.]
MYSPREDTFLMNKALHFYDSEFGLVGKKVLEVGCGNCYNSFFCAEKGAKVFALDVDPAALEVSKKEAKKKRLDIIFIQSDMFSSLQEKDFDLIFFNPPYLPSDDIKDITVDGLEKGRHFIDIFLKGFKKFLKQDGVVLLLHADYNDLEATEKKLSKAGFSSEIIGKDSFFFERLYILQITRKSKQ